MIYTINGKNNSCPLFGKMLELYSLYQASGYVCMRINIQKKWGYDYFMPGGHVTAGRIFLEAAMPYMKAGAQIGV